MTRILVLLIALALAGLTIPGASACQRASAGCLVKSFSDSAAARSATRAAPTPKPQPLQRGGKGAATAAGVSEKFADQARHISRTTGGAGNAVSSGALSAEKARGIGTSIGKLKSAAGAAQKAGDQKTMRVLGSQIHKAEQAQATARSLARKQTGKAGSARARYFNRAAAGEDLAGANRPFQKLDHLRKENIYKMRKQRAARERQRARKPASRAGNGLSNRPASAQTAFDKAKQRPPMRPGFNKAARPQGTAQASGTQSGGTAGDLPTLELD